LNTARPTGRPDDDRLYQPGDVYRLSPRSLALFINRAPRPELSSGITIAAQ